MAKGDEGKQSLGSLQKAVEAEREKLVNLKADREAKRHESAEEVQRETYRQELELLKAQVAKAEEINKHEAKQDLVNIVKAQPITTELGAQGPSAEGTDK